MLPVAVSSFPYLSRVKVCTQGQGADTGGPTAGRVTQLGLPSALGNEDPTPHSSGESEPEHRGALRRRQARERQYRDLESKTDAYCSVGITPIP